MADELNSERFVLRRFRPGDESSLDYLEDEEWRRYLGREFPDAPAFLRNNLEGTGLDFAILAGDELVGSVHLGSGGPVGELACLIHPKWWGRGAAPEVCARLLDHAFRETPLQRAYARCDAGNRQSIRALEKLGLKREATLRRHRLDRNGEWVDEHWYAILRDEWQSCD